MLLGSGVISNWYFSSKKGLVLRKRAERLSILEAAATMIKQAVAMALNNGGVRAVSQYWQLSTSQDPEQRLTMPPLQAFDQSVKDPDIDGQLSAGVVHLDGRGNSRGSGQAVIDKLSDFGFACARAIYEYPVPTAYVKFHEGVGQSSRVVSSRELFHILKDCGSTVQLVQSFIPQRAKQTSYRLVCDYLNIFGSAPPQFAIWQQRSTIAKRHENVMSSPLAGKTIRGGSTDLPLTESPLDNLNIRNLDSVTNSMIKA